MTKRRKKKDGRRRYLFFGITFRIILIIAAISMALSYAAIYINPSKFGLPLFFGLFFIPLLGLNISLFLIALIKGSKSIWIPLVVILPALLYTELFFKIGNDESPNKEGIKLSIESYNVGTFNSSKEKLTRNECRDKVKSHIKEDIPDIICFQEFFADTYLQADTTLSIYKYRYYHLFKTKSGKLFGNLTLSKFPIVNKGTISFKKSTNLSIYTDINHYDRVIRIYNNHLESYNVSFTGLVKKLSRNSGIKSDELKNDIKVVHEKMLGTFIRRSDQVNKILDNIKSSSFPAIICGDFNDTPVSYTYHKLSQNRKDSFKESGKGFGGTFTHLWPVLRIDYILYPKEFSSTTHKTQKIKLSDHYPIKAELII